MTRLLDRFAYLHTHSRAIVASLVAGELADWCGRQLVLIGALVISFAAVGVEFAATTNPVFFVGKFLNGFMVGTIGTVMVGYIGEVNSTPTLAHSVLACSR